MDMTDALRYFGALAIVLALVGVAGIALRRFGLPGITGGAVAKTFRRGNPDAREKSSAFHRALRLNGTCAGHRTPGRERHRKCAGETRGTSIMIVSRTSVWILCALAIGAALLVPSSSAWAAQAPGTASTAAAAAAAGAAGAAAQGLTLDLTGGGVMTERLMQIVGLVTILSLAPSILIMMTCFTRIVVVLSLLRTAIGIQQSPPNSVIVSLALFLTFFVMAPTFNEIYQTAMQPLIQQQITTDEAFTRASSPIKKFMSAHTRNEDLALLWTWGADRARQRWKPRRFRRSCLRSCCRN